MIGAASEARQSYPERSSRDRIGCDVFAGSAAGFQQSTTRPGRTVMGRNFENRKNAIFKTAAQKSKLYSKYGTKLYVAAKNGVADPEVNPALRSLIEKAKRDQVPAHVIEKALEKGRGAGGADFVSARYEGFGPGGALVIVDCLTDNNQRT